MAPREVTIGHGLLCQSRSHPAPLMHVCAESRSHLGGRYIKAFKTGTPAKYTWINFDIDKIHLSQRALQSFTTEQPLIQRLIIEGRDAEMFWLYHCHPLHGMQALEALTIFHFDGDALEDEWWRAWDSQMERFYFTDNPVRFYTKVINHRNPASIVITPDNYLKVERDARRKQLAECPDAWESGYEVSDDDDEAISHQSRFRQGWSHVEGRNCSYNRDKVLRKEYELASGGDTFCVYQI